MTQQSLFDKMHKFDGPLRFDGADIVPERDSPRLTTQLETIRQKMMNGQWWTVAELEYETGHPATSISAQIRNLRKPRMGGWTVERRHVGDGLYEFRLDAESGKVKQ